MRYELSSDVFKSAYCQLLTLIYDEGFLHHDTIGVQNVAMSLDLRTPLEYWIVDNKGAKFSWEYYFNENVFYAFGENLNVLARYYKLWNGFEYANYGHTINSRFCYNQLNEVTKLLIKKIDSRRAILNFTWPMKPHNEFGMPCAISMHFLVDKFNRLNANLNLRSSDAIFGLRYDILYFRLLYCMVYDKIKKYHNDIKVGFLNISFEDVHVYIRDKIKFNALLNFKDNVNAKEFNKLQLFDFAKLYDSKFEPSKVCDYLFELLLRDKKLVFNTMKKLYEEDGIINVKNN